MNKKFSYFIRFWFYKVFAKAWILNTLFFYLLTITLSILSLAVSGGLIFFPGKVIDKWEEQPFLFSVFLLLWMIFVLYSLSVFLKISKLRNFNITIFTIPVRNKIENYAKQKSYDIEVQTLKKQIKNNHKTQKTHML